MTGQEKFNNCLFRSEDQETEVIYRCPCDGGNYEDTGYKCKARGIFKVEPSICEYCWAFKKKPA